MVISFKFCLVDPAIYPLFFRLLSDSPSCAAGQNGNGSAVNDDDENA